jgi:hypothetical protein
VTDPDDLLPALRRWADSGALWRVLARSEREVTVGFFTCDGGEEVQRRTSRDEAVLTYLRDRTSSET